MGIRVSDKDPWIALDLIPEEWFKRHGTSLIIDHKYILDTGKPYNFGDGPVESGIYFLINDNIDYVGISKNPYMRLIQHLKNGLVFKSYSFIGGMPDLFIDEYESFYIHKYKPVLNQKYPLLHGYLANVMENL